MKPTPRFGRTKEEREVTEATAHKADKALDDKKIE